MVIAKMNLRTAVASLLGLAALAAGPAPAHDAPEPLCGEPVEALAASPDGEVIACGTAWRLELALVAPSGRSGSALAIDLLARPVDEDGHRGRRGAYVPGLRPRYRLAQADRTLAEGSLSFRLTPFGPGYGVRVALAEAIDPGQTLVLHVDPGVSVPFSLAELARRSPAAPTEATGTSLRVDLVGALSPRAPDDYNDVWGWNDGVTYLAILGGENGTSFIDVTDPASPVEVGYIGGPNSSWRDIKTFGSHAYIVTEGVGAGEGMQIVDLSNPLAPVLANTYTATFVTAHNLWIDEPAGLLWAVGTDSGVRVLDLAGDPEDPVEVASWSDRYVHDAFVGDGRAFFSEINDGLHEILDASDPASMQVLASWNTPAGASHNSFPNRDQTLTVTTDEVTAGVSAIYDTSDLSGEIPLLGQYAPDLSTIVHNVIVDDEDDALVAVSHYGLGVHLFDMHRPTAPLQLGFYDTYPDGDTGFVGCWGVYPWDPRGYVYGSDISSGLVVLQYVPTGGNVSGIVRDAATGEPLAGADLTLLSDGSHATSGPDGVFAVYAPAGDVVLRVTAPGYGTRIVRGGSLVAGERLDVDTELEPLPTGPVDGRVVRASDGSAIEGARVSIPALGLTTASGPDGSFSFGSVAVGGRRVSAEAFGFAGAALRILVESSGLAGVELRLEDAAFADDLETNRGWTPGVPGDGATSGQWTRVDPNGTGGGTIQPEDDHTPAPGVVAFVTGQSSPGQAAEANDVDGGETTLLTPVLAASGLGAAQVRYQRWVAVEGGFLGGGGSLAVEISADGGTSWTGLETVTSHENRWTGRAFDVGRLVPLNDMLRVRFVATPNSPFNFRVLEAAIDDFELVPACESAFNPERPDSDGDDRVDACDACPLDALDDADGDGLCAEIDNAPDRPNADQADGDSDGVGDVADLCPATADPAQRDLDGDGLGDACDDDLDGDGLPDASDPDRDGDSVANAEDRCPTVPDARQLDDDLDGTGNACDAADGIVSGLRLVAARRLTWEPETGASGYHVYRGDLGDRGLLHLARCLRRSLPAPQATDLDLPAPGDGFFYLVSTTDGQVEGGLGRASDGTERVVDATCE